MTVEITVTALLLIIVLAMLIGILGISLIAARIVSYK